ncbi:hypothetical protein EW026_g2952 [Hermanssonia centrifuga]|uniref:Uncharacterized protein n=1 Tax=Hermanssonia centrifuga TaxID=98765 RepID=A0A4S4KNL7_9APHY|nr:hypothetical protein EW026_g2952 [Hermanssonia centrifuga]
MFCPHLLLLVLGAVSVMSAPHLAQRAGTQVTDTEVLQYALTLENLENAFYSEGLAKLDEQAFADAGYEPWVRARFEQIKGHEQTHVDALKAALGDQAVEPCTYTFPYNDPKSFAALSMALESVGASAYLGAASLISDKSTLTTAASILGVESRQAAWVSSAVLKGLAWNGPFDTPLTIDGVYSLASQFIVSCPDSNPKLPVTTLPKLAILPSTPQAKETVTFQFKREDIQAGDAQLFVAWFDGITVQYSDLNGNQAVVPEGLQGTVYGALVKSKEGAPTEQEILTGLVMFEIGFPSYATNT